MKSNAATSHALRMLDAELQKTERLSAQEQEQLQSSALAALVAHHFRHTPSFAARLRRAKLSAADVNSVISLPRLPTLARLEIQTLGNNFYSRQVPADHQPLGMIMTSGSTGEPVKIRKSSQCGLYWGANTARDHRWNGRDVTARMVSLRPSIPVRTETDWGFPMAALGRTGPALGLPFSMDLADHVREIDEFKPDTLLIFPNVLGGLLEEWERRGGAPPSLRHIKSVGETVRDNVRERALRVCGLKVEDSYSSQECGIIATQCNSHGLYHVMTESVILEVLDPTGQPCVPGESGRLVVTDLRNFASPVIRYEIGDVGVRGGSCQCGLQSPTLQYIMGRDRNLLARPDGSRRYPLAGFQEFHKVAQILQFRFIQHTLHDIELIVHTTAPLTAEQESALAKIVQTSLDYPFEVRVTRSDTPLPRSSGGKFEDFISKVAFSAGGT
jgi:phenylacetate-CoA ligase